MGCDIHCYAERRAGDKYELITDPAFDAGYGDEMTSEPFCWRSYGMFGFLADVRNYSEVMPIAEQRGWPIDASDGATAEYKDWSGDAHSPSWLTVEELRAFDYDRPFMDRRSGRQMTTYRDFLGKAFFRDIEILNEIGADRVLFFFDN